MELQKAGVIWETYIANRETAKKPRNFTSNVEPFAVNMV